MFVDILNVILKTLQVFWEPMFMHFGNFGNSTCYDMNHTFVNFKNLNCILSYVTIKHKAWIPNM
jgi:hypothetical protein